MIDLFSQRNTLESNKDYTTIPNPIEKFKAMLKNNYFTKEYQFFFNQLKLESLEEYISKFQNNYNLLKSNFSEYYNKYITYLKHFKEEKGETNLEIEGEADFENNLFDEYASFDTNPEIPSSGYTTVISDNEGNKDSNFIGSFKDNKNNIFNNNGNFDLSNSNMKFNNGDLTENDFNNYSISTINQKSKLQKQNVSNINNMNMNKLNNYSNLFQKNNPQSLNAEGNAADRLMNLKINKNQLTIRHRTKEEILEFQSQELERYKKPHLPWKYIHPDGSSSVVAPVQKKIPTLGQTKPRDHVLLKADRPSYVTILCLARDAAARLPEGVGTRADICDLLKDSQFINERVSDMQINNIVSGALDRLHYEKDPCVKYDLQKKLWIYLHKNRTIEYEPWNEHLKKHGLSSTGDPLNNSFNNVNSKKNLLYEHNEERSVAEESKKNKETENDDENEDNDNNYNEENSNFDNNEDNNSNNNYTDNIQNCVNYAENKIKENNIFDEVYDITDNDIKMSNSNRKNKFLKKNEKKNASNGSNIISIARNFNNNEEDDLVLNEDVSIDKYNEIVIKSGNKLHNIYIKYRFCF